MCVCITNANNIGQLSYKPALTMKQLVVCMCGLQNGTEHRMCVYTLVYLLFHMTSFVDSFFLVCILQEFKSSLV